MYNTHKTVYFNLDKLREAATICPAPCKLTFDLLTLKVVSESRATNMVKDGLVTWARLRNDLYCVEWDVKLYYTIPYLVTWETFESFCGDYLTRPLADRPPADLTVH